MSLSSKNVSLADGAVIEGAVDKRQGVVVTALVQNGILKLGDVVIAGAAWGKVKKLMTDQGADVKFVGPSTPCQVRSIKAPTAVFCNHDITSI